MKMFAIVSMLLFSALALNATTSQAEEGCMVVNGHNFCCKDHIVARFDNQIIAGVIDVIYTDGNAVVKWETGVTDTRVLADLTLAADAVECFKGLCQGNTVFAKFASDANYYEGEVKAVFSDGSAKIKWTTGVEDVRVISEIPMVTKVDCLNGLCSGEVITAKYEGKYYDGTVGVIFSDGMAKIKWTTGVEDFRLITDLPIVERLCDRERTGHCHHHDHDGHDHDHDDQK